MGRGRRYLDKNNSSRQAPNALFVSSVLKDLVDKVKHNKRTLEKLASSYGITNKTLVKELTEFSIVKMARSISLSSRHVRTKYHQIVDLYKNQVNLSHRTSQSVLLQQYSTPAPIGFLLGLFVNANEDIDVFEPSAGNGLLTIAANPANVTVNEIDEVRRANLLESGYRQVLNVDATNEFKNFHRSFDAIITNPPFGRIEPKIKFGSFSTGTLDHLMVLRALDTMKDDGKASIIIGGHNRYDRKGRFQKGEQRFFFNHLYHHYNVVDLINISGRNLFSRQGTSFNTRLILINGRKTIPSGAAPTADKERDKVVTSFDELYARIIANVNPRKNQITMSTRTTRVLELEAEALALELELLSFEELGMPYEPASSSCFVLNTVVPDSMGYETHEALRLVKESVGGDIDEYVRIKLNYKSKKDLCKALSAEQIDAIAMSIYNIEERGIGMIIGDQTGIGKGRVAASIIRYGVNRGLKPIFITEKANLFSDIYRDLSAIGSAYLVPFIINARESKTDIKDENGQIVHQALSSNEQESIFSNQVVPANYHFVVGTYSQFNSPEKKPTKPLFLKAIAKENIVIMDEAHNSSGSGNTGSFMQSALADSQGVVFLSATFAKRADNMPIYAMKTSIRDASMSQSDLIEAISKGGVALQEILASQLVAEGQMIRRERSFEGVEVNYVTLDDKEQEHKAIADNITSIVRDIIQFQGNHVDKLVDELDNIALKEGKQVEVREGTSQAGVDNLPYFSKVFNVVNQMLFSIKAESVAERAIERLKEGKKPVIAFSSTMGSFIEQMESDSGMPASDGTVINADFSVVLQKGLDGILRYTETDPNGEKIFKSFNITDFSPEAQAEYFAISERIKQASTGITISPIDVILERITSAGYTVAEVTGRKFQLQINRKSGNALVLSRRKINTNDAFRQFNNNEVDVLLINQSGSTGASAHAIVTPQVPKEQVKQRVMIVLQAELDINTEVQKRGRINRTGQIMKPIYDYVNSAIPAEKRLMMMLQKKLKSLDANTTSNQKSSTKILDVPDFLNKYGDKIVAEYLKENPAVNNLLDDPLGISTKDAENVDLQDAAHKVSGRVAVLSTSMQHDFYNEISLRYNEYTEYLKQIGEYDLEVEAMDLQAEVVSRQTVIVGRGGQSQFGDDSILETVSANVLRKPFTAQELSTLITDALEGSDAKDIQQRSLSDYAHFSQVQLSAELQENERHYQELIESASEDKKLRKLLQKDGDAAYQAALQTKIKELQNARNAAGDKIKKSNTNKAAYVEFLFKTFWIGRSIQYPFDNYNGGQELIPAVFLGFMIDKRKKNPYVPSAIKLRFAISNSNKYIAIPASYAIDIRAIAGASVNHSTPEMVELLSEWETAIKESSQDRKIRHIVTGNVLQAFAIFKGKLVSYTTIDGGIRKGILMPEFWEPQSTLLQKTLVPIGRAIKIIRSLPVGKNITTKNEVSLFRQNNGFSIVVSASRAKGGDIFLNPEILSVVQKNNFEKVSDKMIAAIEFEKIDSVVKILDEKFSDTLLLTPPQFELIKEDMPARRAVERRVITLPVPSQVQIDKELELEALALELELELLEFAA